MSDVEPSIFDGHNDVLTRLLEVGGVSAAATFVDGSSHHVDLVKARRGGFGGGFFALWVSSPSNGTSYQDAMRKSRYDVPLPAPLEREHALHVVSEQTAVLQRLAALGALEVCTSVNDIRHCLAHVADGGPLAAVMHLEGAEAIDPEFHALEALHAEGLRSLGPVWSRPTIWGHGVPFRFPGSPDTGPGLTEHGVALVKRCNEMNILIDLSHLNEAGFRDVAAHSVHPLVATHSNAHALCAQTRNLTDTQLAMIRESEGMVGLNFACAFLREDGQMDTEVPLESMLRHLDHLIERVGEEGVGLGSDFDGAVVPDAIGDAGGLGALRAVMRAHGYDDALMERLCHGNWLRVLERTWGPATGAARTGVAASTTDTAPEAPGAG